STGTVIGPASGGAAFAAASAGETMNLLRPMPSPSETTAVAPMIQMVRVDPVTAILRVPPSGGASPPLLPTWSQPTDPQPTAPPDCHWAHCSSSDLCSS